MSAKAPNGMSYVNAFYALWACALPSKSFVKEQEGDLSQKEVQTDASIVQLFKENKRTFSYVGKRWMGVDFSKFPNLNVERYERRYGQGVAQRILDKYSQKPSSERIDRNDVYQL